METQEKKSNRNMILTASVADPFFVYVGGFYAQAKRIPGDAIGPFAQVRVLFGRFRIPRTTFA